MKINSFSRLYIHTLKDIYNAEQQLTEALPKMAKAASTPELQQAFEEHLEETKGQIDRLDSLFDNLDFSPTGETCEAMKGLIEEGEEIINNGSMPDEVRDAGLIAAAQKVEHYEIASYGTAVYYAKLFNHDEAVDLLQETLNEEKNADAKLNDVAINQVNQEAVQGEDFEPSRTSR